MDYTITHKSGVEYIVTIKFSSVDLARRADATAFKQSKKMNHKGFRRGQMPIAAIKRMFGESLYQVAAAELVEEKYAEILQKEAIDPAGTPEVDVRYANPTEGAECVVAYSIYPTIELPDLRSLVIAIDKVVKQSDDYQAVITIMRERNPEWQVATEPAAKKNRVTINFHGTLDGKPFQGGSKEGQQIILGEGTFLPDLENALIGMHVDEEKTVPVRFPEEYQTAELAGKTASFALKVCQVETSVLPALNADFFATQGAQVATVEAFEEHVQRSIKQHTNTITNDNIRLGCMQALRKATTFDVPEGLKKQQASYMREQMIDWMQKQQPQMQLQKIQELVPLEQFFERANERVADFLLFGALSKALDVSVSDDDIDAFLQQEAATQPDYLREQTIAQLKQNQQEKERVDAIIIERKTFAKLCELATVSYTDKLYLEYFKQNNS